MSRNTESNLYTVLFATGMVIIVGAMLAFINMSLKDKISENRRIEKQQNILYALGINDNDDNSAVKFIPKDRIAATFSKYIVKEYVIDGVGSLKATENPNAYLIDIKKEEEKAKNPKYVRQLPLFIGEKNNQEYYIVPVRGKGLWDAIWGYVALNKDFVIEGVFFDHAGETPGLGANIKERFFMDDFTGEHILDPQGDFESVTVTKGNNDPKNERKTDYKVDAIAGATITGNGLTAMLKKDIKMYLPYLESLKK